MIIFVFRTNAVGRESAAKAIGAVMHDRNGLYDRLASHTLSRSIEYARYGTAGWNPHLPFSYHEALQITQKRSSHNAHAG